MNIVAINREKRIEKLLGDEFYFGARLELQENKIAVCTSREDLLCSISIDI